MQIYQYCEVGADSFLAMTSCWTVLYMSWAADDQSTAFYPYTCLLPVRKYDIR